MQDDVTKELEVNMAISSKTRKLLWGKSGNRCAICKKELVVERTSTDDESIVGEECHIISPQPKGPRYRPGCGKDVIDSFGNLILLCSVHHKMVDDQCKTYSDELLKVIRDNHYKWVGERLADLKTNKPVRVRRVDDQAPYFLDRITRGKQMVDLMHNVMAYNFDYDDLESPEEVALISSFVQDVQDLGDIMHLMESGDHVQEAYKMTEYIKEIEAKGFLVFGIKEEQILEGGGSDTSSRWNVVVIRIVRPGNECVVGLDHVKQNRT